MFASGAVVEVLDLGEEVVESLGAEEALGVVRRFGVFFFSGESDRSKRLPDPGVAVLPAGKIAMDPEPCCILP